ncbi:MAG: acyltransferase [Prevotella sp.]|nr:acyltransferase [Prevotella sp.]
MIGYNFIKNKLINIYLKSYILKKKCINTDIKQIRFFGFSHLKFHSNSTINIGNNFICRSGVRETIDNSVCSKIIVKEGAILEIGNNVGISNTSIICTKSIRIGDYVKIGAGTLIMDSNFHSIDWKLRMSDKERTIIPPPREITINNHVFIGARCIINKGVSIGTHSIIAAGSVVLGNIPPDELWGGNPAKFIKKIN